MRHAKTESAHAARNDKDRNLNETGIQEAQQIGKILLQKNWIPQSIICSTAHRTIQTLNIVNESLHISNEHIQYFDNLYLAHTEEIFKILTHLDNHYQSVLCIGHNPSVTHFPFMACEKLIEHVPTGGVLKITFEANHWNEITKGSGNLDAMEYPTKKLY